MATRPRLHRLERDLPTLHEHSGSMTAEAIRNAAEETRRFYEQVHGLRSSGCCDVYAERLLDCFDEHGIKGGKLIEGAFRCPDAKTRFHCWVEIGETIVDVTADQFAEFLPRIVIGTYADYPQYVKGPIQ